MDITQAQFKAACDAALDEYEDGGDEEVLRVGLIVLGITVEGKEIARSAWGKKENQA